MNKCYYTVIKKWGFSMFISLNPELATTGLIYRIIKQKKFEHGKEFSWKHVNGLAITPETVTWYRGWLTHADCGAVLPDFNNSRLLTVFEKNTKVLKKLAGDQYIINIDPDASELNHEDEDFMDNLMKYLITQFQPNMNYSSKFINFIVNDFEPKKEKTKVKNLGI